MNLLALVLGMMVVGEAVPVEPAPRPPEAVKKPNAPNIDDDMVFMEDGTFLMGAALKQPGPYGDGWFIHQTPQHEVTLSPFLIDREEITVSQFALFLTYAGGERHFHKDQPIVPVSDGYIPAEGTGGLPMHYVTWEAAHHYCLWAGKHLPTEAQWEYVASNRGETVFPWAEGGPNCTRVNYFTGSTFCQSGPTGALPEEGSTFLGVSNMVGNVAEWVADWYGPYSAESVSDPTGAADGVHRVVKGGGFMDVGLALKSFSRRAVNPALRSANIGFRCARSATFAPDETGVIRGQLEPAKGSASKEGPLASPQATPSVIARGLIGAKGLAKVGDTYFVTRPEQGELLKIESDGTIADAILPVLSDTENDIGITSQGSHLYIAYPDGGGLFRITDPDLMSVDQASASMESLASLEPGETLLSTDGESLVISGGTRIQHLVDGTMKTLVKGLDGAGRTTTDEAFIYYSVRGAGNASLAQVARVSKQGGEPQVLLDKEVLGTQLEPVDLAIDASNQTLIVGIKQRNWPYAGAICRLPQSGGNLSCRSHSPPGMSRLVLAGGQVVWSTQRTVAITDMTDSGPFQVPGILSRAAALLWDGEQLIWLDGLSGNLYTTFLSEKTL